MSTWSSLASALQIFYTILLSQQGHLVTYLREKLNYLRKPADRKRGQKRDSEQQYKPKTAQMPTALPMPKISDGEDEAAHDRHVKLLKAECKKVAPNRHIYKELMKRTFGFRRQGIYSYTQYCTCMYSCTHTYT